VSQGKYIRVIYIYFEPEQRGREAVRESITHSTQPGTYPLSEDELADDGWNKDISLDVWQWARGQFGDEGNAVVIEDESLR
jgi:hypothetical protein